MIVEKKSKSPDSFTIILTEKPDASTRIANALAEDGPVKKEKRGVYWYEFKRDNKKFLVVSAVGHIFALDTVKDRTGWNYPTFNVEWVPSYTRKGSEFSKKYFDNIKELAKKGDNFIVATDYDTEGSVIGFNILRFLFKVNDAKRMKFSTLTKEELIESYENASQHLDFGQIESGLTRHYLDFFWGINLTRALTIAMKNQASGGFAILSTGRVQGPTLDMLFEKELNIRKFKPESYWQIELLCKADSAEILAVYEKDRVWDEKVAKEVFESTKKADEAEVKDVKKRQYFQSPPVPFNTTDLQADAYAHFNYSPSQTMRIAESLYQSGIISYPRSSSQKLPPTIGYERIIRALSTIKNYSGLCKQLLKKGKLQPNEGNRTDPAHPAIYPTAEIADLKRLTSQQKKLYDLIVRRFLAVFAEEAKRESVNVILDAAGNKFIAVGKRTIEPGWIDFYKPYAEFEEQILPELKVGQVLKISKVDLLAKETQPPGRYSQGSILKEMEKRDLGTRATRAEILQTLYNRNYIVGKSIQVTKLGETVTTVLKEFCPRILSEELTRHFEKEMEQVFEGTKKREVVVKEAEDILVDVLGEFKKNEKKIGEKLLEGLVESRREERRLGVCPNCKTGELRIIFSKKTGKRFCGCSNYPNCKTGYPLPLVGSITSLNKSCEVCGLPVIQVWRKGRRPFRMCILPTCETKADWGKKKKPKGKSTTKE